MSDRKRIAAKANKEFRRTSGFDLMYIEEYTSGQIELSKLIAWNHQWLLDHVNDVGRGLMEHMSKELRKEP